MPSWLTPRLPAASETRSLVLFGRNFVCRDLKFKVMTLIPDLEASGLFISVKAWLLLARLSLSFLGMREEIHTKFQLNRTIRSKNNSYLVFMARAGSLEVTQKIMTNFNFSLMHKVSAQSDDWIFRYIFLKIVNGDFWGPFFACCLF